MIAVNVIHIHANSSGQNASDAWTVINNNVTQAMWGPVGSNATVTNLAVTKLDGISATYQAATSGLKWTGQASSGSFQPQVAAVIKMSTNSRGRANRGRVFLPFIVQSGLGDGSISGSVPATTSTAWSTFISALNAASPTTYQLVVASYDRAHSGAGAHETAVSSIFCETLTATQRRRQGRVRGQ
jgi:hypothetical protein